MSDRAKELAQAHWEGYVKPLLLMHGCLAEDAEIIGFHYTTAAIHFYGHGVEDERNGMYKQNPITTPLRYPPAHPYKHKDEVEVCATCQSWGRGCQGREDVTACDKYIPPSPPADPWAERDLCRRCGDTICAGAGKRLTTEVCKCFKPAE